MLPLPTAYSGALSPDGSRIAYNPLGPGSAFNFTTYVSWGNYHGGLAPSIWITTLPGLDSVQVPFDGESDADDTTDPLVYRVVQVPAGPAIALPDNPLTWTSTAYLLWDEVDPGDPLFTALGADAAKRRHGAGRIGVSALPVG